MNIAGYEENPPTAANMELIKDAKERERETTFKGTSNPERSFTFMNQ